MCRGYQSLRDLGCVFLTVHETIRLRWSQLQYLENYGPQQQLFPLHFL